LDVAGRDGAVIPQAVAVLHGPGQDVGDRLDPAMRVPGEAGQVILGNVIAEVVQEAKRIEVGRIAEAKRPPEVHARAFERRLGLDETLNRSNGHADLLCSRVTLPNGTTAILYPGMLTRRELPREIEKATDEHGWKTDRKGMSPTRQRAPR